MSATLSYDQTAALLRECMGRLNIDADSPIPTNESTADPCDDTEHTTGNETNTDNSFPASPDGQHQQMCNKLCDQAYVRLGVAVVCCLMTASNFMEVRNFEIRVVRNVLPRVVQQLAGMTNLLQKASRTRQEILDALSDIQNIRLDLNRLLTESSAKRQSLTQYRGFLGFSLLQSSWGMATIAYALFNPAAGVSAAAIQAGRQVLSNAAYFTGGAMVLTAGCWYFTQLQIDRLEILEDKINVELNNLLPIEQKMRALRDALPPQPPAAAPTARPFSAEASIAA